MQACIDEADPRGFDTLRELGQRGARQIGIYRDVMALGKNTAQFEKIRINARFSSGKVEEPHLSCCIECRSPLLLRCEGAELFSECLSSGKAVLTSIITFIQKTPIGF